MSGTYFMSGCEYRFQLTAYVLPTAITGSESLMQYKVTSQIFFPMQHKNVVSVSL